MVQTAPNPHHAGPSSPLTTTAEPSAPKHTPGPWVSELRPSSMVHVRAAKAQAPYGHYAICFTSATHSARRKIVRDANVRLICAAPGMADTLRFVSTDPCFSLLGSVTQDEVRAAIALALGNTEVVMTPAEAFCAPDVSDEVPGMNP